MNTTTLCLYCKRPIRGDARAYAANGGFYHWECTEPPKLTDFDMAAVRRIVREELLRERRGDPVPGDAYDLSNRNA